MTTEKQLLDKIEQASKDAHYAYTPQQRADALAQMDILNLALKQVKAAAIIEEIEKDEESVDLDFSEQTFLLEVTVRRQRTNEVSGTDWFDPEDFAVFLRDRHVIDRSAKYGLDAYNKHSGQDIIGVRVI